MSLNPKAILIVKLTEDEFADLTTFDCNDEDINNFIKNIAFTEQNRGLNTTFLLYYEGKLAGYYSICADSIRLTHEEKADDIPYSIMPAIKIARIGRDISFKGYEVGKYMIEYVVLKALEIGENMCGVRMITLDAYPNRVEYYESLGFRVNLHSSYQGKKRENVSMRYDIYSELF